MLFLLLLVLNVYLFGFQVAASKYSLQFLLRRTLGFFGGTFDSVNVIA